jgi:exopolyphosphatase/guanosine-5'-triphosphate,3'-diphosphate pyrophosphatase
MRYTVVDIGSNTMRMSVYDDRNGNVRHIMSEKELVGLIGYTSDGVLSDEGILRVTETLSDFKETSDAIGSDVFSAFATAGLRNIKNTQHAVDIIRGNTGVSVTIIGGDEEARLDFVGAYNCVNLDCGLMIDMGGGSTELVRFCGSNIENSVSLPFGSLYLYKNFVRKILPDNGELKKIDTFVSEQLEGIEWLTGTGDNLCLIGGTSRAAARLRQEFFDHRQSELQGFSFDATDISRLLKQITGEKRKSSRVITRVTPERLHTILPGLCALSRIIKRAGCKTITISRNGVREGYLHEYVLGGATK